MKPSNQFFLEWRALKAFVIATGLLCIAFFTWKQPDTAFSPWYLIGLAGFLYLFSGWLWMRSKGRRRHRHQR